MKKRLKLVGNSSSKSAGGLSVKGNTAATVMPYIIDVDADNLQDDVDAEGDADDEVDAEMHIQP